MSPALAVLRDPLVALWLTFLVMDLVALAFVCLALRDEALRRGR